METFIFLGEARKRCPEIPSPQDGSIGLSYHLWRVSPETLKQLTVEVGPAKLIRCRRKQDCPDLVQVIGNIAGVHFGLTSRQIITSAIHDDMIVWKEIHLDK